MNKDYPDIKKIIESILNTLYEEDDFWLEDISLTRSCRRHGEFKELIDFNPLKEEVKLECGCWVKIKE